MLRHYFTIARRNVTNQPVYTLISVLGLAIGLATCILIGMFVRYELSVDAWHEKGDRIYRMIRETRSEGEPAFEPRTSGALAIAMRRDFPEVEAAVRIWPTPAQVYHLGNIFDFDMVAADAELFDLFGLPFLQGSSATAFTAPYSMAITESTARRIFGEDDPIGKRLSIDNPYHWGEYTVTAILEDMPRHSTLQFDFVAPPSSGHLTWVQWSPIHTFRPIWTYVLLRKDADVNALRAKLPAMVERYMGPAIARTNAYHLQPFREAYLCSIRDYGFSLFGGNIAQLYQFIAVSLFVLAIAGMNFTNLTTALSVRRAREVGVRKVTGASKTQLVTQFMGESVLKALAALALAIVLVRLALPEFNTLFGKQLALSVQPTQVARLGGGAVALGVAAGAYPALLASLRPSETLKGFRSGTRGQWLRKTLVVGQFTISIVLIVGTGVIFQQLEYLRNKNLGYEAEQIVFLPILWNGRVVSSGDFGRLRDRYEWVKETFLRHPNVLQATAYRYDQGTWASQRRTVEPEGHDPLAWKMPVQEVDEDFLKVLRIEIVAGRNFDPLTFPADPSSSFILNEAAVKALGWEVEEGKPRSAIGKSFKWVDGERNIVGKVIGVVRDFHYGPLQSRIGPLAIIHRSNQIYSLALRIGTGSIEEALAFIEDTWEHIVTNGAPFQYQFWDQRFEEMHARERRVQTLSELSSGMAILLACMGLFALAALAAEERRKEIGIRKTLGASVPSVVMMMSKEFVLLVGVSALIATPVVFALMRGWLDNFAYRTELGPGVFVFGALVALVIAQTTVTFHSLRAAHTDPVQALRE
jgi:putative ABC transport system permease protein